MAMKITYTKAIDGMLPSLQKISTYTFPKDVPVSHLLDIAENIEMIESKSTIFWDTRKKILEDLSEKDDEGVSKTLFNEELKQTELLLSDKNKSIFQEKLQELRDTELDLPLKKLSKEYFNGVENLTPQDLKGILMIMKN